MPIMYWFGARTETVAPAKTRASFFGYLSSLAWPKSHNPELPEVIRPVRVLSVCETAKGGVGRFQESLRAVETSGFEVSVLLPEADESILTSKNRLLTFPRTRRDPASLWSLVANFLRVRRALRPNLYFFNSTFSLLPLAVLRLRGDRSPAVYCAHCWAISNYDPDSLKGRIVRLIEGRLAGLADLVINVSNGEAELAREFGYRGRHVVIENAVPDISAAPNIDTRAGDGNRIDLLFVGRFDRQKGVDILLSAFERARQLHPELRLRLIGEPVRGGLVPHLPVGVTHMGWLRSDQLDEKYRAADALIVPSRWEGLPLIVPEALRNGTPILLSDRSGMAALVNPGESGEVFELDEAALVRCLSGLTRARLRAMRPAARRLYEERYSITRFSDEMARHLTALVQAS